MGKENHYDALDHRAAVGGHHCRPHVHPGVEMAGVDGTVAFGIRVGAQSFFRLSGLRYSHGDTDSGSVHNPRRDSFPNVSRVASFRHTVDPPAAFGPARD